MNTKIQNHKLVAEEILRISRFLKLKNSIEEASFQKDIQKKFPEYALPFKRLSIVYEIALKFGVRIHPDGTLEYLN